MSPFFAILGAIEAIIDLWTLDRVPFGKRIGGIYSVNESNKQKSKAPVPRWPEQE